MSKIENAAQKAEEIMTERYGNAWLVEVSEGKFEILDEFIAEYDHLFDLFMIGEPNDETSDNKECESELSSENS